MIFPDDLKVDAQDIKLRCVLRNPFYKQIGHCQLGNFPFILNPGLNCQNAEPSGSHTNGELVALPEPCDVVGAL